ncbi:MAG TPA: two-component regulator propeller domain-containing protein [Anaerolineales bacterium]|nr:two-component regulator propeller domain-containing protein [Anaerolineales bacterium]
MAPFRKHAFLWAGCLLLLAVTSACGAAQTGRIPAPTSTAVPSRAALWTNTFPPLQYNGSTLRFYHYSLEEGLSQSSVQAIFQDAQGYLWIGTQDGLNRFDGYSFKVFRPDPSDASSLSSGDILSITDGTDGALWIGTNAGLNRYDPATGRFSHWMHSDKNPDGLSNDMVRTVYRDAQGRLWVGTRSGLDQFDPAAGKFQHFNMLDKPAGSSKVDAINALFVDDQQVVWIGTNDGLVRYGLEDHRFQRYQNNGEKKGISFDEVSSISQDRNGVLWIGTHDGLDRLDPSTGAFTPFVHLNGEPKSLADNFVQSTYIDRAGQLWVGTPNGLDRFLPSTQGFAHYRNDSTDPASLSSSSTASIYEDRGGNLWVGTDNGGLNEHDRSQDRFAYYHHSNADPESLSSDVVFPILPADGGKIWIGTSDAGLNLFDPASGTSEHFRHDPGNPGSLLDDTVISLFVDKNHALWVGTHQGLDRRYPASTQFMHYINQPRDPLSIPFGPVYSIYQDQQSTYYVGTGHGLRVFEPATGSFSDLAGVGVDASGLDDSAVMCIYQDRSGILWFGTNAHGLFRFNPVTRELKDYTNIPGEADSLSSNSVLNVGEDSQGTIWVSTFGGGLDRYVPEDDSFTSYRQGQGLPNDVVYGVEDDGAGHIWLSTNMGLARLTPSSGVVEDFTVDDGLQSNEFDSGAVAKDAQGRLYFGGVRGLTVFDPKDIQPDAYVPPMAITSLAAQDGAALSTTLSADAIPQVTLAYPVNSFDFSFAALSFSQAAKNQYKYKLDGFDQDWHNAGPDHRGSYTNLPGGDYTLMVIGSNSDGTWNDAGVTVRITVIPPFWQTWLFRAAAVFGLLVAASLAYRSRVHNIEAQKTALEHVVMDRTQALKQQNLDLQALYSADEKMLRVLSQDEILQALVDVAVDTLQADKSAVFMQAAPTDEYRLWVCRGFRRETVESPEFANSQQTVLRRAAKGIPITIDETAAEFAWNRQRDGLAETLMAEGVRSALYIPIKLEETVIGIFAVCSSSAGAFDDNRRRLFVSLVRRAALSLENSQLIERTKQIAVLEERNRMAQELHDSAKQKAFAALAQLGAAKKLGGHNGTGAVEHLDEAEDLVSEVIHDLTFFIHEAYPDSLMETGLAVALREDAKAWQSRTGIRLQVAVSGERRLPVATEEALYRIAQEALSNIARHSQATQANLDLTFREHEVEIQVADNGVGFDRSQISEGLGLRLIHERLDRLGGEVDMQSGNGYGTVLTVRAPI